MVLRFGDVVFNFIVVMIEGIIIFYEWFGDGWGFLFLYFVDFIFVCIIELGKIVSLKVEFDKRNVKVMVVSVDFLNFYYVWIKDIEEM